MTMERARTASRAIRALCRAAAVLAVPLAGYLVAAVVLGILPVNSDAPVSADGILVFLRSNGLHAEIAVPIRSPVIDWSAQLYQPVVTYSGVSPAYISFGWGDAEFYVRTRSWHELRPWTALSALAGRNGSVIHVEHVPGPSTDRGDVPFRLSTAQYRRLADYITSAFQRTGTGQVLLATERTFGHGDRFYVAHGSYGPVSTCNEWVRRGLSAAGVRTARWAPFDVALFWHARR